MGIRKTPRQQLASYVWVLESNTRAHYSPTESLNVGALAHLLVWVNPVSVAPPQAKWGPTYRLYHLGSRSSIWPWATCMRVGCCRTAGSRVGAATMVVH